MKNLLILCIFVINLVSSVTAQETFPENGVRHEKQKLYVFTNATIYLSADSKVENADMIIRNGKVENVGKGLSIPKGAIVVNCTGKTIYPSFIDLYTNYGMPEPKRGNRERGPQFISNKKGAYHWNEAIRPEFAASSVFTVNEGKAQDLRSQGFGMVLSYQKDGIARGTSVLVNLMDERENKVLIKDKVGTHYSFSKGMSTQDYPSSLMGSIALLRQAMYDADWYSKNKTEYNLSYEALNTQKSLPAFFECGELYDVFRAKKIADEFGLNFIYKTTGTDYQRIKELKATNATLIVSLQYPKAYDVEDYFDAMSVNLTDLKHWELAPYNPSFLEKEKILFALTTSDLKNTSDFLKNLRKAVKSGLSEQQALKSLTTIPAEILKISKEAGSLQAGMKANFIITTGNLFSNDDANILENWIEGNQYVLETEKPFDIRGSYTFTLGNTINTLNIKGSKNKPDMEVLLADSSKSNVNYTWSNDQLSIIFDLGDSLNKGKYRLSGAIINAEPLKIQGEGMAKVNTITWSAIRTKLHEEDKKEDKKDKAQETPGNVIYPYTAYGSSTLPQQKKWLIKNATVWTNEKDGKVENMDVLIDKGKIAKVGKNLSDASAISIDGKGKHVTPGIIDEHSHIAITRGVNEGTQAVTSEVRIGDVLDPDDINIYRQLAGGVTSSQLLHGSANPIGGQSQLIKLRWGKNTEELKFENADPFIKFALGENVKQSNWGSDQTVRFPQTRMGVEQVYIDAFGRAKEYEMKMKSSKGKTRRDLELDALVEIMNKKRFITCHSYVQSEINMLIKVADSFKFTVNTFTHILEGYKVADKMKTHGSNASTFSDWWAYKYEVIDAIPYNGAIMSKAGLNVSFNSDDAEMARRLNQEAGKAIKYGNITEEEALKFITLNPAKMLHIDDKVGSIKEGKSADIVIWTDHPLSVYAKPVKTFVDGIDYYDLERDTQLRKEIALEKERIIQKLLNEKKLGMPTQKPAQKEKKLYHCDDIACETSN